MSNDTILNGVATVPSGVDDAVGVPARKWFVAIVSSKHEKSVAEKLCSIGIENYVAIQKEMHLWKNGRRRMIDRIVIPAVVFVRCTEHERRFIVTLPYINRFMVNRASETGGLNKPVAIIPDAQIDKLKFMLGQSDYQIEFTPEVFRTDDNVRVIRGPLFGLTGSILEDSDGTHKLMVSLPILGGAVIMINPRELEKIPTAHNL